MAYFDKYDVEFTDDRKTLVKCPKEFEGEYKIPDGVTSIRDNAFSKCENLVCVTIPNSVVCIGRSAFEECRNLRSVHIATGKSHINKNAYDATGNRIPIFSCHGLNDIGGWAFKNCVNLQTINLSHGLENIGYQAFYNCCNLLSITIPNTVLKIGDEAFYNCCKLTEVYLLNKNSAIDIGDSVFPKDTKAKEGTTMFVPQNQVNRINTTLENLSIYISIKESLKAEIQYLKQLIIYYFGEDYKEISVKPTEQDNIVEYRKLIIKNWANIIKEELSIGIDTEHSIIYRSESATIKISGYEIPNEIYQVFIDAHEELPQQLWASSGKLAFEKMRDQNELRVGKLSPRLGYYQVCDVNYEDGASYMYCKYNMRDALYFVDEIVKVKISPFNNKFSLGPKKETIKVGDIIQVEHPVLLVESSYDANPYQSYKVIWKFIKHTDMYSPTNENYAELCYENDLARFLEETFVNDR